MAIKQNITHLVLAIAIFFGLLFVPLAATAGAASTDVYKEICDNPDVSQQVKDATPVCQEKVTENPLLGEDGFISKLIRIFALATAVVAVITILISGFMFVSSQGDTSGINTAKTTLIYAVVGLIVAALAQLIVLFVVEKL